MAQPTIHEQTSVSQCGEAAAPRRDDTFYLDVVTFRVRRLLSTSSSYEFTLTCFQVSNTLFRVPRYAFEGGSAVFASMFTLPPGQGQDTEGCSEPIRAAPLCQYRACKRDRSYHAIVILEL